MPIGPGKYAAVCNRALVDTDADAVILVIIGGKNGAGFDVQGRAGVVVSLPPMLRHMADVIEKEEKAEKQN